jgi:conjugative transposon TraN protein
MTKTIFALTLALLWAGAARAQESPETKIFPKDRIIAPFKVEVTFAKTTHILFPSEVRYIDLGSHTIIAGKASGVENVVRVKAAVNGFDGETNFSVITADGSFYSFDTVYADDPVQLSIEMTDWLRERPEDGVTGDRMFVRFKELAGEVPAIVNKIMYNIYKRNRSEVNHLGSNKFGIQARLKGIYIHGNVIYFHTQIKNPSNVAYDIDFIRFKVVEKKVARRTAIQEPILSPVRSYNDVRTVRGKSTRRHVFAFEKFTIPDDKVLTVEIYERGGGRHQSFTVENTDLTGAKLIGDLTLK